MKKKHLKAIRQTVFALAAFCGALGLRAQTLDSIPHHYVGDGTPFIESLMEMHSGGIVSCIYIGPDSCRVKIQKLNCHPELALADSVVHHTYHGAWSITARDPNNYNKGIFAEYMADSTNGGFKVNMRRFDNHLVFEPGELDVHVTDDDSLGNCGLPGMVLDRNGDLVIAYYYFHSFERNFMRIGPDGEIKHHNLLTTMTIDGGTDHGPFIVRESPLTYCYFGNHYANNQNITHCYLLDSLFNITESIVLPHQFTAPLWLRLYPNGSLAVCAKDDGSLLFAMPYGSMNPQVADQGLAILRYDGELTLLKKFPSDPYVQYQDGNATTIGLDWGKDGNLYLAYSTNRSNGHVSLVKMDSDLNVIWERYCLESGYLWDSEMLILKDNKVAIVGVNVVNYSSCDAFYIVVNDDYDGLQEQDNLVRPYMFYPNPVQDQLRLHYSPDVEPAQIGLYDLQGRLVRSQGSGLESLSLQGLAPGQYVMKVTMADGTTFSDKVVKE